MIELKYLILVVVFLGYIAGIAIGRLTKDEFNSGRKWLVLMQKILIVLLAIGCLYYVKLSWMLGLGFAIGIFTISFFGIYFYFGILGFLSIGFYNYVVIVNSLMFLFGLPYGTINSANSSYKKNWKVLLFFAPFILLVLGELNISWLNLLFGICCGGFARAYYMIK